MIPFATTTISVLRSPADEPAEGEDYRDPYDTQPDRTAVHVGVRAHISAPSGREQVAGGEQAVTRFGLACDPIELRHTDWVLDETTDITYRVVWAARRTGLPALEHTAGALELIEGAA